MRTHLEKYEVRGDDFQPHNRLVFAIRIRTDGESKPDLLQDSEIGFWCGITLVRLCYLQLTDMSRLWRGKTVPTKWFPVVNVRSPGSGWRAARAGAAGRAFSAPAPKMPGFSS